jgi:hypothetical protein
VVAHFLGVPAGFGARFDKMDRNKAQKVKEIVHEMVRLHAKVPRPKQKSLEDEDGKNDTEDEEDVLVLWMTSRRRREKKKEEEKKKKEKQRLLDHLQEFVKFYLTNLVFCQLLKRYAK